MPAQGTPGIFIQKLAELTQWQRQQQEKLLQEQETQRQILSKEQQRMYDVYGHGPPMEITNSSSKPSTSHSTHDRGILTDSHITLEPSGHVALDDVPLSLQKRNFSDFLQEKLHEDTSVPTQKSLNKLKRPFLRKGQGLARFHFNPETRLKHTTSKKLLSDENTQTVPTRKSLGCSNSVNTRSSKDYGSMEDISKSTGNNRPTDIRANDRTTNDKRSLGTHQLETASNLPLQSTSLESHDQVPTWARVLSQAQQPVQEYTEITSMEKKKKREMEELRVFELLEQKAANSSFCSTSSAIAQLMSKSVQSTPIKSHHAWPCEPAVKDTDKSLHVRFADTNDYKNVSYYSDTDNCNFYEKTEDSFTNETREKHPVLGNWQRVSASTSTQEPCAKNGAKEEGRESIRNVQRDYRDTNAWSDDDSCISSSECGSQSGSSSSNNETLMSNQQPVREDATYPDPRLGYQADVEERKHTILRNAAEDVLSLHRQVPSMLQNECDTAGSSTYLYKSDLLRTRLQELEKEIETFRKENAMLSKLRRSHELEVLKYRKEKKEAEKKLDEERENLKSFLDCEKKKLAKEKLVYERYSRPKELKDQTSKSERAEIAALKVQVENLREELVKKDSRWSATQVRTRDRVRLLENENSELKKQIQNLRRERQEARQFKIDHENGSKTSRVSNTKVIHAINNHIGQIKPKKELKNSFVIKNVVPKKPIPKSVFKLSQGTNQRPQGSATARNGSLRRIQSVPDMGITSSLEDLSGSSLIDGNCSSQSSSDSETDAVDTKVGTRLGRMRRTIYDTLYNSLPNPELSRSLEYDQMARKTEDSTGMSEEQVADPSLNSVKRKNIKSQNSSLENSHPISEVSEQRSDGLVMHKSSDNVSVIDMGGNIVTESIKENGNREKIYNDGRKEIWYPNGNVKKVSHDKAIVKMIYFNGDVKETRVNENIVKYYYAETGTWHTTFPDRQELLEFPNGQVERRTADGLTEITFSNGCMRMCYADGRDEWSFPDGTRVKTNTAGEKVVQLSNGQREVHTLAHKRREYPDGTVKIVYPDGLQETRYANGRIRLKDKEGNLLLDSAAEN